MLASVFSTTMSTLKGRWAPILGSMVVSAILVVMVAIILLLPAFKTVTGGMLGASQGPTSTQTTDLIEPSVTADGMAAPGAAGAATDPFASDAGAVSSSAATTVEKPGIGSIIYLVVAALVFYAFAIAMMTNGVFAAAGYGVKDAIKQGAITTPHAIVQTLRVAWQPMVAYAVGFALSVLLPGIGTVVGMIVMLVGFVLALRIMGTTMMVVGAIAHGHDGWDPIAVREATEGRRWNATGVALVGVIASSILNIIPFLGTVFLTAFQSAMWQEYGDGAPPRAADALPTDPYGQHGAHSAGAVVATGVPAPHVAVAAAVAVPAATAAPQLVAGPTWNGVAAPQQPAGAWITLAAPANVGLQVQWTSGAAPAVMVADQAGTWTTPASQPTTPGEATWIELPAGNSWVAIMPRGAEAQQVWAATWLPAAAAAAA